MLWNVGTASFAASYQYHQIFYSADLRFLPCPPVCAMSFSADGLYLATTSAAEAAIRIWVQVILFFLIGSCRILIPRISKTTLSACSTAAARASCAGRHLGTLCFSAATRDGSGTLGHSVVSDTAVNDENDMNCISFLFCWLFLQSIFKFISSLQTCRSLAATSLRKARFRCIPRPP